MFERSAEIYDALYSFKDYADESRRVVDLVRKHHPSATSLLDVACGTGMHLAHLRAEYEVEGLDLDERLLDVARVRLPDAPLHLADMRDFDLGRRFDVVTCLFSSIGYVQTRDELSATLGAMRKHLRPEGILLFEPWFAPDEWETGRTDVLVAEHQDDRIVRASISRRHDDLSEVEFHYLVARHGRGIEHFSETHLLALFTPQEYVEAIGAAGLALVDHDPEGLVGRGLYVCRAPDQRRFEP